MKVWCIVHEARSGDRGPRTWVSHGVTGLFDRDDAIEKLARNDRQRERLREGYPIVLGHNRYQIVPFANVEDS